MAFNRFPIGSRGFVLPVLAAALANLASAVWAQPASNIAPSTFQPENQRATTGPVTVARDPGAETPPGADRLFVTVGKVTLEGAFPQMETANTRFVDTLEGRRVPASEIFRATRVLEAEYTNAGFVLARVVLPQQTVRDGGTLRIVVIDGFVERVDTGDVPPEAKDRVDRLVQPLVGQRALRLRQIERALLLAGDTYGLRMSSTLAQGERSGGTALLLDGEFRRWTGSVGFDNSVSDDLGPLNLNAGVELNGALGLGETFYGRLGGSPDSFFSSDAQYRILAAGAVVPIGPDGLTFNIEGTASVSTPQDVLVPTDSSFDRLSLRLYYPWVRSRNYNLTSQFILDRQSDEQSLIAGGGGFPIYEDELTVLRASLDGAWNFENGGFLQASATLSQGIDALGARTASDAAGSGVPLSRQGADAEFTKLVLGLRYDWQFDDGWSATIRGRAQENFGDPMLSSEQFSIAGIGEMSTFDAGDIRGDDGWILRGEVGRQMPLNLGGLSLAAKPYLFGAYGVVGLEQPTVFEQGKTKATSYGLGIEFLTLEESPFRAGSLRLEYGRGERDDLLPDGNRFNIVANRRF